MSRSRQISPAASNGSCFAGDTMSGRREPSAAFVAMSITSPEGARKLSGRMEVAGGAGFLLLAPVVAVMVIPRRFREEGRGERPGAIIVPADRPETVVPLEHQKVLLFRCKALIELRPVIAGFAAKCF